MSTQRQLEITIVELLRRRPDGAAFVTELRAACGESIDSALTALDGQGHISLCSEPAPDPHLERFDLRVAAIIQDDDRVAALRAARLVWEGWVRQFLANHRCQ